MYDNKTKQKILAKRDMARFDQKLKEFVHSEDRQYDREMNDLFYDQFSGIFFQSSKATILAAELAVNRECALNLGCHIGVFYNILGIDFTRLPFDGDYWWYIDDKTYWIDFDHVLMCEDTNLPYHLITMIPEPIPRDH